MPNPTPKYNQSNIEKLIKLVREEYDIWDLGDLIEYAEIDPDVSPSFSEAIDACVERDSAEIKKSKEGFDYIYNDLLNTQFEPMVQANFEF